MVGPLPSTALEDGYLVLYDSLQQKVAKLHIPAHWRENARGLAAIHPANNELATVAFIPQTRIALAGSPSEIGDEDMVNALRGLDNPYSSVLVKKFFTLTVSQRRAFLIEGECDAILPGTRFITQYTFTEKFRVENGLLSCFDAIWLLSSAHYESCSREARKMFQNIRWQ